MSLANQFNEWIASVSASDRKLLVASSTGKCHMAVFFKSPLLWIRFATDGRPESEAVTQFLFHETGGEATKNVVGVSGIYDPSGMLDMPPPAVKNLGTGSLVFELTQLPSRDIGLLFTVKAGEECHAFAALLPFQLLKHEGLTISPSSSVGERK